MNGMVMDFLKIFYWKSMIVIYYYYLCPSLL